MSDSIEPMGDSSSRRLTIRAALRTDVGLVRSENQDFGTCTTSTEEQESQPGGRLLIVADGMGGHRGGATASRLAAETVKAQYLGSETADILSALHDALIRANARIYSEAQANPDLRGMGTTVSVLAVRDGRAWLAHVGDSRIYMVRGDEIRQLTEDHSLVASMVREGLLTSQEAENHPRRNVLQRSMGVAEDVEIDVGGPFELQEGDTFILCSDGLHGLVKEAELKEVAVMPVDEAAEEFVRRSLQRGAPDNVTVIVGRVERQSDVGDDTIVDRRNETTAPMPAVALDDTLRDHRAVEAPAEPDDSPVEAVPAPMDSTSAPEGITEVTEPAAETPAVSEPPLGGDGVGEESRAPTRSAPASGPVMKWMLLVVLVLAAGTVLYLVR